MREYANDVVYTIGGVCRDRGAADAAPHLGVGPRDHRAPLAAADQRDRRRVPDRAGGAAAAEEFVIVAPAIQLSRGHRVPS